MAAMSIPGSTALPILSRPPRAVPRENASGLVLLFAASCALTISATRAYLVLTGYPQIGGKTYHLAHALWGGLLLAIAALLASSLANAWVAPTVAFLGGVGSGLFVDEVGKFITQKNDYFFPLAAAIVYLFLVLLALATAGLSRWSSHSAARHLANSLELATELAMGRENGSRVRRLVAHLDQADGLPMNPVQQRLADALRTAAVPTGVLPDVVESASLLDRMTARVGQGRLRRLARTLLFLQALSGTLTLIALPLGMITHTALLPSVVSHVRVGTFAATLTIASFVVTGVAGVWSWRAFSDMSSRDSRPRAAMRHAMTAAVLLLLGANTLGAYTSQFSILLDAGFQLLTGGAVALWFRGTRNVEASTPAR